MMKNLMSHLRVIPIIATYFLVEKKVVSVSNADGISMQPTIQSGDVVVVDHFFCKYFNTIKKDDIVVAIQPVNPEVNICKRVIQVGSQKLPSGPEIIVPANHYWLEGDNKSNSYDSRHHGAVPANLIVGKVIFIISV